VFMLAYQLRIGTSDLAEIRTSEGGGCMRTCAPKRVVNSRGALVTATTAAQPLTRRTRQGCPSSRMRSPTFNRERLIFMVWLCVVSIY